MNKIIQISTNNYSITCTLSNNKKYIYDMSYVVTTDQQMLQPLKDKSYFNKVFIELGSLVWPNGYDIHANTIVREGLLVDDLA